MGRGNSWPSFSQSVSCPQFKTCHYQTHKHTQKKTENTTDCTSIFSHPLRAFAGVPPFTDTNVFFFHVFCKQNLTRNSEYRNLRKPSNSEMTQGEPYPTHFYFFRVCSGAPVFFYFIWEGTSPHHCRYSSSCTCISLPLFPFNLF